MTFDRLLYLILTGSLGRFAFNPGPVSSGCEPVPDPVGIYVHIPFCRSLCPFCPYTKVIYDQGLAALYSRCLESEVGRVLSGLNGAKISSIYFGGGTPMMLPGAVESLIKRFEPHLIPDAQVALEAHPGDVTPAAVSRLSDIGINMVSLGAESLNDGVLVRLGRNHSSKDALAALRMLLDSRRFSVNVDLMTGIPGQELESSASDMRQLMEHRVDQVSSYPLMDFPFTQMRSTLSLREQRRLLDTLASIGSQAGYRRSSVWTWTKPASQHYTSITRENYLGIGAGAASQLGHHFWLNAFGVETYVDAITNGKSAVSLSISLGEKEAALYRLFWRCYDGEFDLRSPEALEIPTLRSLVDVAQRLGLATRASSVVRLSDKGFFLYHILERYYTRRYIGRLWQSCREADFPAGFVL